MHTGQITEKAVEDEPFHFQLCSMYCSFVNSGLDVCRQFWLGEGNGGGAYICFSCLPVRPLAMHPQRPMLVHGIHLDVDLVKR